MKCNVCCCVDHKQVLEEVVAKLKSMNLPIEIISAETITDKAEVAKILKQHQSKFWKISKKSGSEKYANRFRSYKNEYQLNLTKVRKLRSAYVYCNKSEKWIKTHSYIVDGKSCECAEIVRDFKIYSTRSTKIASAMKRNKISIKKPSGIQLTGSIYHKNNSNRIGGRRLQVVNTAVNYDATLVKTFRDHLLSFKTEDRALLAKCFA